MKQWIKLCKYNTKGKFVLLVLLNLMYAGVIIVVPLVNEQLVDGLTAKDTVVVYQTVIYLFLIFIGGQGLMYAIDIVHGICEKESYVKLIEKAQHVIMNFDPKKNEITQKTVSKQLSQNYLVIKDFIIDHPVELISQLVLEIGIFVVLLHTSTLNAFVVLVFVPIFILISSKYGDRIADYGKCSNDAMEDCRSYLEDKAKVSFSERFRTTSYFKSFSLFIESYKSAKQKQVNVEAFFSNVLSYASLNFLIFLTTVICVYQVMNGTLTVGGFFAVTLCVSKFWGPMEYFVQFYKEYCASKNIMNEFVLFLDSDTLMYESSGIELIRLNNYQSLDHNHNVLHKPLDIEFEKGILHVIKGDNGSGKTTLALSLLGLSDRYCGDIEYNEFERNNNVMYSIAEPLISSYTEGSDDQIKKSMGQFKLKQLQSDVKEDKILYIFDEPTNYLDYEKKMQVRTMIDELVTKNKIVIVISHDQDFIKENDHIVKLEKVNE